MALPRIDTPTYQLILPSTRENIDYRPFLMKEQKIIMMAQESKDDKQIIKAMIDLVTSCTFGKVDISNLPTYDVEFMFLKIRGKSAGESVELNLVCPDDNQTKVEPTSSKTKSAIGSKRSGARSRGGPINIIKKNLFILNYYQKKDLESLSLSVFLVFYTTIK